MCDSVLCLYLLCDVYVLCTVCLVCAVCLAVRLSSRSVHVYYLVMVSLSNEK